MSSLERKMRRKNAKKQKKEAEQAMATKVALFGLISDRCMTCEKPFDKKDKQMVMSWNVVVYQEKEKVNLYCPECWESANKVLEEFRKRLEDKHGG